MSRCKAVTLLTLVLAAFLVSTSANAKSPPVIRNYPGCELPHYSWPDANGCAVSTKSGKLKIWLYAGQDSNTGKAIWRSCSRFCGRFGYKVENKNTANSVVDFSFILPRRTQVIGGVSLVRHLNKKGHWVIDTDEIGGVRGHKTGYGIKAPFIRLLHAHFPLQVKGAIGIAPTIIHPIIDQP